MKRFFILSLLISFGCSNPDDQNFTMGYDQAIRPMNSSTEILKIEGTMQGPFKPVITFSFREDEVPNAWVETKFGKTQFVSGIERKPFSEDPEFLYTVSAFESENKKILFVLRKHSLSKAESEQDDADNPVSSPENPKNHTDD